MGAPRLAFAPWRGLARGALLAVCLWPGLASAQEITGARYSGVTSLYGHLVLGKSHNWSTLEVTRADGAVERIALTDRVFEDTAPRVIDMDGDGAPEVMVVEAKPGQGARVAFYGGAPVRLLAATPYIGTNNRWYAPVGAADLDGDGTMEFAFVDRPHLAKVLRVWRYGAGAVREIATLEGITNHRIGEDWISGGLRDCGSGPEMVLASGNWARMLRVTFDGALEAQEIGRDTSRAAFDRALVCD